MAFCVNCGKNLDDGTEYCPNCGKKTEGIANDAQNPYAPPQHDSVPIPARKRYIDYDVIQPNNVLRACARKQLPGVWGQMALAYFVYFLIIVLPQFIFSGQGKARIPFGFSFNISWNNPGEAISTIAVYLIAGPFALGFAGYFIKRIRDEEITLGNIFDGFKRFFPSFLVMFFMVLFITLWSLLLVIPGIIKAFGYSMAYYVLHDNPAIGSLEAIKKSQILMKGYKFKLFCLYFSFIGWFLLGLLTFGIGYLWIYPYVNLSVANFYENLKEAGKMEIEQNAA